MNNITDTGIRGYLKWLQHDQPGLYAKVAAKIAQAVPEAFSDHEQSQAQGALMGFGSASDPNSDVSDAANAGAASPSVTSVINNIVTAASQAYMAKQQADLYAQINQAQLQRAQLGLGPGAVATSNLGIPYMAGSNVTASMPPMGWLVLGGFALVLLMGRGGGHRAAAA